MSIVIDYPLLETYQINSGSILSFPIIINNNTKIYTNYLSAYICDFSLRAYVSKETPIEHGLDWPGKEKFRAITPHALVFNISDIDTNATFFVDAGTYYLNIQNMRNFPNKFKILVA